MNAIWVQDDRALTCRHVCLSVCLPFCLFVSSSPTTPSLPILACACLPPLFLSLALSLSISFSACICLSLTVSVYYPTVQLIACLFGYLSQCFWLLLPHRCVCPSLSLCIWGGSCPKLVSCICCADYLLCCRWCYCCFHQRCSFCLFLLLAAAASCCHYHNHCRSHSHSHSRHHKRYQHHHSFGLQTLQFLPDAHTHTHPLSFCSLSIQSNHSLWTANCSGFLHPYLQLRKERNDKPDAVPSRSWMLNQPSYMEVHGRLHESLGFFRPRVENEGENVRVTLRLPFLIGFGSCGHWAAVSPAHLAWVTMSFKVHPRQRGLHLMDFS